MLASRMRAQVEQAFGSESHRELNLPMTNYVNRIANLIALGKPWYAKVPLIKTRESLEERTKVYDPSRTEQWTFKHKQF